MTQTYVYKGEEVYLTGRKASKKMRNGAARMLYEVRPIKYINNNDSNISAHWIEMKDVYEIIEDNNDEH